ncbi:hypothetical protein ACLOJK_028737 [Asimina triloba]
MRNSRRAVLQTGPHAETSCVVLVVLAAGRKSHPRQTSLVGEMGRRKLVAKSSQIPYRNRSAQGDRDEGGNLRKAAHLPSSSPLLVSRKSLFHKSKSYCHGSSALHQPAFRRSLQQVCMFLISAFVVFVCLSRFQSVSPDDCRWLRLVEAALYLFCLRSLSLITVIGVSWSRQTSVDLSRPEGPTFQPRPKGLMSFQSRPEGPTLARISKTKNGETFLELDNGKTLLAKSIDIMCIKHLHTTKRLQSSTEGVEEGIQLRPSFHNSNAIPYSAPTILSNISKACQLRTVRLNSLAEGVKEGIQLRPSFHSNNIIPYPARTISSNISKACQLRKVRLAGLAEGVEEGIQRATVTKEDES